MPFIALLLVVLGGLLGAAVATTWRPPDPDPLRRRRQGGQIFRATTRVYVENLPTFAAAGAIFVPVYLVAAAVQWVIFHLSSVAPLVALDGRRGAVTAFLAVLIGGIGGLFASVIATAAVAVILNEIDLGRRMLAGQACRRVLRRLRPLNRGMATELGAVLLLTITVVGVPIAIHRFIRWSLFAEACMLDYLSATDSLRRSSLLVRGRWWRTFGFSVLVDVLAILSGPLFGVGLLLLTDHSLNFINSRPRLSTPSQSPTPRSSSRSTTSTSRREASPNRGQREYTPHEAPPLAYGSLRRSRRDSTLSWPAFQPARSRTQGSILNWA